MEGKAQFNYENIKKNTFIDFGKSFV